MTPRPVPPEEIRPLSTSVGIPEGHGGSSCESYAFFTPAGSYHPTKAWRVVDVDGVPWATKSAAQWHEPPRKEEESDWPAVVLRAYLNQLEPAAHPITGAQFARMMDAAYEGKRPDDDRISAFSRPEPPEALRLSPMTGSEIHWTTAQIFAGFVVLFMILGLIAAMIFQ